MSTPFGAWTSFSVSSSTWPPKSFHATTVQLIHFSLHLEEIFTAEGPTQPAVQLS